MRSVSIIIPVKDDEARLRRCINAILDPLEADFPVEIIVVDNGSAEPLSKEQFPDPRVTVLSCPENGSYAARNAGIKVATGEVFVFTDSHCLPEPTWLKAGLAHLEQSSASVIAGAVEVFPAHEGRPNPVEYFEMLYAFPQKAYVEGDHFGVTANVFARCEVFDKVGGFAEKLYAGGDREWGRRAWRGGFPTEFAPTALVLHPARSSWKQLRNKIQRTTRLPWSVKESETR